MLKYNLGCGKYYEDGWCNVEHPNSKHKADIKEDLLKLEYQPCEHIKSSHVFEHFGYVDSIVLLYKWSNALVTNGVLEITVPDIQKILNLDNPFLITRLLYGSQFSQRSYHINGWCKQSLSKVLEYLGFAYLSINDSHIENSFIINGLLTNKSNIPDYIIKHLFKLYQTDNSSIENEIGNELFKQFKEVIK